MGILIEIVTFHSAICDILVLLYGASRTGKHCLPTDRGKVRKKHFQWFLFIFLIVYNEQDLFSLKKMHYFIQISCSAKKALTY